MDLIHTEARWIPKDSSSDPDGRRALADPLPYLYFLERISIMGIDTGSQNRTTKRRLDLRRRG